MPARNGLSSRHEAAIRSRNPQLEAGDPPPERVRVARAASSVFIHTMEEAGLNPTISCPFQARLLVITRQTAYRQGHGDIYTLLPSSRYTMSHLAQPPSPSALRESTPPPPKTPFSHMGPRAQFSSEGASWTRGNVISTGTRTQPDRLMFISRRFIPREAAGVLPQCKRRGCSAPHGRISPALSPPSFVGRLPMPG